MSFLKFGTKAGENTSSFIKGQVKNVKTMDNAAIEAARKSLGAKRSALGTNISKAENKSFGIAEAQLKHQESNLKLQEIQNDKIKKLYDTNKTEYTKLKDTSNLKTPKEFRAKKKELENFKKKTLEQQEDFLKQGKMKVDKGQLENNFDSQFPSFKQDILDMDYNINALKPSKISRKLSKETSEEINNNVTKTADDLSATPREVDTSRQLTQNDTSSTQPVAQPAAQPAAAQPAAPVEQVAIPPVATKTIDDVAPLRVETDPKKAYSKLKTLSIVSGVATVGIAAYIIFSQSKAEVQSSTDYKIISITKESDDKTLIQYEPADTFIEGLNIQITESNSYPAVNGYYKIINPKPGVLTIDSKIVDPGNKGIIKYLVDFNRQFNYELDKAKETLDFLDTEDQPDTQNPEENKILGLDKNLFIIVVVVLVFIVFASIGLSIYSM